MSGQLSIGLNAAGDIYVDSNGNLAMVTNVYAIEQDCLTAMRTQFGEMFLNPTGGLPSLSDVWNNRNFIKWEAVGRTTLTAVPGVVRVVSFITSSSGNTFSYVAQILTIYSPTLISISGILDGSA